MRRVLPIVIAIFFLGSCKTAKKVGSGASWTYEKTKSGMVGAGNMITTGVWGAGRMVGNGAKKLWPWKKKVDIAAAETKPVVVTATKPPAPVTKSAKPLASPTPAPPPRLSYAKGSLWVTDSVLGNDHRHSYDNTSVKLEEGWEISGAKLTYAAEYADSPPKMLRAEGSPARAKTASGGNAVVVEASQIHYRQETGLLALKGFPKAHIGSKIIEAASSETVLILNLNDGSFQAEGPIKTSSN